MRWLYGGLLFSVMLLAGCTELEDGDEVCCDDVDAGPGDVDAGDVDGGDEMDGGPPDADTDAGGPVAAVVVAAGASHTCAGLDDGRVFCWGSNQRGQTNPTNPVSRPQPITEVVVGLTNQPSAMCAGGRHSCVSDGTEIFCWGDNSLGQLGRSRPSTTDVGPAVLPSSATGTVEELACGEQHTCARVGLDVYCWGDNAEGQAGQPDAEPVELPTLVPLNRDARAEHLGAGHLHTCVATGAPDGVQCFGDNGNAQVCDTTISTCVSAPLGQPRFREAGPHDDVALGQIFTCALPASGPPTCWPLDDSTAENVPPEAMLGNPTELAAGGEYVCAAAPTMVSCWGEFGVLGLAGFAVPNTAGVRGLSAHQDHVCGIQESEVLCWGANTDDQVSADVDRDVAPPTRVVLPPL